MSQTPLKFLSAGMLGVLLLAVSSAQDLPSAAGHRTGLLRDDEARVRALVESHPRVTGVKLNWLGLERVDSGPGRPGPGAARGPFGRPRRPRARERPSRRRLRSGRRPGPPQRRRPAGLRRQQRAQVLPAHPQPEPARLVRLVLDHLLPALLHGRLPAGPRHPEPRRQHEQVLPEVVLQHAQRRQGRGDLLRRELRPSRTARGRDLGRVPLRHQLQGLVPGHRGLASRAHRPDRPGPVPARCQRGRRPRPAQTAPDQRLRHGLRDLHFLLAAQADRERSLDRRRRRGGGRCRRLLGQRRRGLPRHDRRRLQRRRLDRHQRQRRYRHGREGRPAHRQLLGQRLERRRLHLAGLRRPARGPGRPRRSDHAKGAGLLQRPGLPADHPRQLLAPDDRGVHGQPRQARPDADVPRAFGDFGHDPLDRRGRRRPSRTRAGPSPSTARRRRSTARLSSTTPTSWSRAAAPNATTWGCATARPETPPP